MGADHGKRPVTEGANRGGIEVAFHSRNDMQVEMWDRLTRRMTILLLANVPGLGSQHSLVDVSEGRGMDLRTLQFSEGGITHSRVRTSCANRTRVPGSRMAVPAGGSSRGLRAPGSPEPATG